MSENVYTPGGNPVCDKCGRWYGLGADHVCGWADGCERCDWTGWIDDKSACGDEEHCSPAYPCSCNEEGLP